MKKYKRSWTLPVKNEDLPKVIAFCKEVCGYNLSKVIDPDNACLALPNDTIVYVVYHRNAVKQWFIIRRLAPYGTVVNFKDFDDFMTRHLKRG